MNTTYDRSTLLSKLSKIYVFGELGLDPKMFERTADSAWILLADRLLRHQPHQLVRGRRRARRPSVRVSEK
jgi:hypothetical protein